VKDFWRGSANKYVKPVGDGDQSAHTLGKENNTVICSLKCCVLLVVSIQVYEARASLVLVLKGNMERH
jgi:hypothetical protein